MDSNMLGGLSDDEIQALLATMGDPAELQGIEGQQAIADKLRSINPGDRDMIDGGHGQRFADVGGIVSDVLQAKRGEKMGAGLDAQRRGIFDNQKAQAGNFLDALTGHRKQIQDLGAPDTSNLPQDPEMLKQLLGL